MKKKQCKYGVVVYTCMYHEERGNMFYCFEGPMISM